MKIRIIFIILFIFLVSLAGGVYYVNKTVLPNIVRQKIIAALSDLTSGKVTMEDIHLNLLRGIVISNLTLFEKDNPQKELCSIQEASATFLIWPFFKEKKVIFPTFNLKSASINLSRQKDSSFNISYLIDKLKSTAPSAKAPGILFKSVEITNSAINFTDAAFPTPVLIHIKNINLSARMLWNKAAMEGSCELARNGKKSAIKIKGQYTFNNQHANANLLIKDLDLKLYREYLGNLPVTLEDAQLSELNADCILDDKGIIINGALTFPELSLNRAEFSFKGSNLSGLISLGLPKNDFKKMVYQGKATLENASLSTVQPISAQAKLQKSSVDFSGDLNLVKLASNLDISDASVVKDKIKINNVNAETQVSAAIPLSQQQNLKPSYEGTLKIKSAEASGIPTIDKASEITSTVKFKNSDLLIEDLLVKTLDTHVQAKGSLKANILNLDISGDFDLAKLLPLIPKEIKLPPHQIAGTTTLSIHLTSEITKGGSPLIAGDASLKDLTLTLLGNNLKFQTDKGRLKFDTQNENLQWHFEAIRYQSDSYSFDGSLKDFKTPFITAMVIGKGLRLHTELTKKEDMLNISLLKGQFKSSSLNLKGKMELNKNLKVSGTILLDFADLATLLPQTAETLKKTGLQGQCLLDTEISGPIKEYRLWSIKAKGKSKQIRFYGLRMTNVSLDYAQDSQKGLLNGLTFDAYHGKGLIRGTLNLSDKKLSYDLSGILQDIDLALLKTDTAMKDKTLSGTLGLNVSVKGQDADANGLEGNGALTIKNGNIWEFNPLKGLGTFLFIPRFNTLVFTSAQGDFVIQNGYISTDNLELLGPELGLIAEGKMSFAGDLDFLVNSQISLPVVGQTLPGKIVEETSKAGSLSAIKITGTVQEPKYKLQPIAQNIMKKLGEILSNITP